MIDALDTDNNKVKKKSGSTTTIPKSKWTSVI